jgi:hypothetical protein
LACFSLGFGLHFSPLFACFQTLFLFVQTSATKQPSNNNSILLKHLFVVLKAFIFKQFIVKLFETTICPENDPVFADIRSFVIIPTQKIVSRHKK